MNVTVRNALVRDARSSVSGKNEESLATLYTADLPIVILELCLEFVGESSTIPDRILCTQTVSPTTSI